MNRSRTEIIELTPKQSNVYAWGWQSGARFRTAVCGRRFGKTYIAAREIKRAVQLAAKWDVHPDNEIWYGCPSFKQAKRVFWPRVKRALPPHWVEKRNESDCSIVTVSGHTVRLVGLDLYDSLRGSGLFFFVGDEWADVPPLAWDEVISPMLSTSRGHALKIGTPKGFDHFYDAYVEGQPGGKPDCRSWLYTTADGGNVPPEELTTARERLDPRTYEQEYEARFVTYSGRVIYAFSRAESVRADCVQRPDLPLHIGMDFNVNPMSATVWQEWAGAVWQVGEVVIPTSNTDEMATELARRYGNPRAITVYPDPAGAQRRTSAQGRTDVSILRDAGFNVTAMSSHPLVRDRVNLTNSQFLAADGSRKAFVGPQCRRSIEAYERLVYKDGTSDPDKDGGYDHLVDATGYYFFARFGGHGMTRQRLVGF